MEPVAGRLTSSVPTADLGVWFMLRLRSSVPLHWLLHATIVEVASGLRDVRPNTRFLLAGVDSAQEFLREGSNGRSVIRPVAPGCETAGTLVILDMTNET